MLEFLRYELRWKSKSASCTWQRYGQYERVDDTEMIEAVRMMRSKNGTGGVKLVRINTKKFLDNGRVVRTEIRETDVQI